MRRDIFIDFGELVIYIKDEMRVWMGCIRVVLFDRGRDVRGIVRGKSGWVRYWFFG